MPWLEKSDHIDRTEVRKSFYLSAHSFDLCHFTNQGMVSGVKRLLIFRESGATLWLRRSFPFWATEVNFCDHHILLGTTSSAGETRSVLLNCNALKHI